MGYELIKGFYWIWIVNIGSLLIFYFSRIRKSPIEKKNYVPNKKQVYSKIIGASWMIEFIFLTNKMQE